MWEQRHPGFGQLNKLMPDVVFSYSSNFSLMLSTTKEYLPAVRILLLLLSYIIYMYIYCYLLLLLYIITCYFMLLYIIITGYMLQAVPAQPAGSQ